MLQQFWFISFGGGYILSHDWFQLPRAPKAISEISEGGKLFDAHINDLTQRIDVFPISDKENLQVYRRSCTSSGDLLVAL